MTGTPDSANHAASELLTKNHWAHLAPKLPADGPTAPERTKAVLRRASVQMNANEDANDLANETTPVTGRGRLSSAAAGSSYAGHGQARRCSSREVVEEGRRRGRNLLCRYL